MADEQNAPSPAKIEAQAWRLATLLERAIESIPLPNRTYQLNRIHQTIGEMRSQDATRIHRLLHDHPETPARKPRHTGTNNPW
jgi:hypothetical protein